MWQVVVPLLSNEDMVADGGGGVGFIMRGDLEHRLLFNLIC